MIHRYNIELMINSKRLKLKRWQYLPHYFYVIFISLPILYSLYDYILGRHPRINSFIELLEVFWPFLIVGTILFSIQYSRLKFTRLEKHLTTDKILETCSKIARDNNWKIKTQTNNMFQASAKGIGSKIYFVGELITVLVCEDMVLINSICDPSQTPALFSFGQNKKHKQTIINKLKNASA